MIILSEIGRDMSRFPTAGHLVAWAGLCPGQNESSTPAKRRSSRLRKRRPLAEDLAGPMRLLRIPTKPAMHSERKPATDSDLKPAGIPI